MFKVLCKGAAIIGFDPLHYCNQSVDPRQELKEKFQAHMEEEGLNFATKDEYEFRFEIFSRAEDEINEWNS